MPSYTAPLRDMRFVMDEVFDFAGTYATHGLTDASPDLVDAVLEESAKFAGEVLAPLNRTGDEEGCHFDNGVVTTPRGFKEAYQQYVENGWAAMSGPVEFGGQGLPASLGLVVNEMTASANYAWNMYPGLTHGCAAAIRAHGTQQQKELYLNKLVPGYWTGTMCLTEPHCGTDLGLIKTRAVPQEDGSYAVTGTKIFISSGEHDMAENIIHLVLAKLPDAPAGPKGISLFLVPKFLVNEDGSLGERNAVTCGSIEHKMGIKGSATCVMNFDGARGYLIGEVNKGLNAMFTMMNYERLSIGIQGIGCAEASYQSAVDYARERIQSRAPTGAVQPDKAADPIIVHPDVRRMLLTMKAMTEGSRAFSTYVGMQLDISKFAEDEAIRKKGEDLVALLTPVAKAFFTDVGFENCVHGQQVFGGHGYIREWGQEQLVRDVRIAQIYEGTNGIQALDLMGRKTVANGGAFFKVFAAEIQDFIAANNDGAMAEFVQPLQRALDNLTQLTEEVIERSRSNPNEVGAASVEYLHTFGYTAYAYMWARMASVALAAQDADDFYQAKLSTARFYFKRLLPRIHSLSESVRAGSDVLFELDSAQF